MKLMDLRSKLRKIKKALPVLCGIAFLYGVWMRAGITCPIKFLTGVSCPGCGMTRAVLSALRGDFKAAFYFHPLFPLPFLGGLIYLFCDLTEEKTVNVLLAIGAALLVGVYIARLLGPESAVVSADFRKGFLYQVFEKIRYSLSGV